MKRKCFGGMLILLILALVGGGCFIGCSNSGSNGLWTVIVRVAGQAWLPDIAAGIPAVWTDEDNPVELPTPYRVGAIEGLFVTNGDVYASGSALLEDEAIHGVYWKNGEMTILPGFETGSSDTIASAVEVVDGSVYLAGTIGDASLVGYPAFWIDDKFIELPVHGSGSWRFSQRHVYQRGECLYRRFCKR